MRVDSRSIFAAILAALLLIGSATPPGLAAQTSEWRVPWLVRYRIGAGSA